MRSLRILIGALILGLGGGPLAIDGCLINCHVSTTTGQPHCHQSDLDSSTPVWHARSQCDHDHQAAWADAQDGRVRLSSLTLAVVAPDLPVVGARNSTLFQRTVRRCPDRPPLRESLPLRI